MDLDRPGVPFREFPDFSIPPEVILSVSALLWPRSRQLSRPLNWAFIGFGVLLAFGAGLLYLPLLLGENRPKAKGEWSPSSWGSAFGDPGLPKLLAAALPWAA